MRVHIIPEIIAHLIATVLCIVTCQSTVNKLTKVNIYQTLGLLLIYRFLCIYFLRPCIITTAVHPVIWIRNLVFETHCECDKQKSPGKHRRRTRSTNASYRESTAILADVYRICLGLVWTMVSSN